MPTTKQESLVSKVVMTLIVGAVCLVVADVMLWSRSEVDLFGTNPVSLAAGKTSEREFTVDEPGLPHLIQLRPYTSPETSTPVTQDTRYTFKLKAVVVDPSGATVHEFSDTEANHLARRIKFTPNATGKHIVKFHTAEGEQRADLFITVEKGSAILRFFRGLGG